MSLWTQAEAIELCRKIEAICPPFGCHVALTGGLLYKDGPRKDCDILFYRIRQNEKIDDAGLVKALAEIGVKFMSGYGFCLKFMYCWKPIDAFFPEELDGCYEPGNPEPEMKGQELIVEFNGEDPGF